MKIEQVAIYPKDPDAAQELLEELGLDSWTLDTVTADGHVYGEDGENVADLAFNYDTGVELEILHYREGSNWMDQRPQPSVSHLGMHCTAEELKVWRKKFAALGILVAQEVFTSNHTNPFLVKNGRKYHYVIFNTHHILGVDLKFIVRRDR